MDNPLSESDPLESRNRIAYDRMVRSNHFLTQTASREELANPLKTLDAKGWLGGDIRGWNVLCLAAGGGRQGPLYAAAGARVTVLDISPAMLELDRKISAEVGLNYKLVQGSMSNLGMFDNQAFDLVAHPVSTCYVSNPEVVFREVARVLRPGGLYVSQHKQPANLQSSLGLVQGRYVIETEVGQMAKGLQDGEVSMLREPHTFEYAHSLDTLLGGICRAGMVIEEVSEPDHADPEAKGGSMGHRSRFLSPYIRIKARRVGTSSTAHRILVV